MRIYHFVINSNHTIPSATNFSIIFFRYITKAHKRRSCCTKKNITSFYNLLSPARCILFIDNSTI